MKHAMKIFVWLLVTDQLFFIFEKHSSDFISYYLTALLTNRLFILDQNWSEFIGTIQSGLNY